MKNPLGVSPSKGNQGTTRGKEKIFWRGRGFDSHEHPFTLSTCATRYMYPIKHYKWISQIYNLTLIYMIILMEPVKSYFISACLSLKETNMASMLSLHAFQFYIDLLNYSGSVHVFLVKKDSK